MTLHQSLSSTSGVKTIPVVWGSGKLGGRSYAANRQGLYELFEIFDCVCTVRNVDMMSKHVVLTGRVGGEALANRGGEARLVDDRDLSAMVGKTQEKSC